MKKAKKRLAIDDDYENYEDEQNEMYNSNNGEEV